MEQSHSWEANKSSASQEIPCILWNRIHKPRAPVAILSMINAVHVSPSPFFKIHFSIILPSTPMSSKLSHSYLFIFYISLQSSALNIKEKPKDFKAFR
jgi:hypothetical protein